MEDCRSLERMRERIEVMELVCVVEGESGVAGTDLSSSKYYMCARARLGENVFSYGVAYIHLYRLGRFHVVDFSF